VNQFEDKFSRLWRSVGAKNDSGLARALGVIQQTVSAARKRKTIPCSWIIKISENYGISCDWLLYGEGPKYRNQARLISAQPSPPVEGLHLPLIREIVVNVEETLGEYKMHLPPRKKAELIALLYEEFAEDEERQEIPKEKILRFARALVA
jgi:hypothetical protein